MSQVVIASRLSDGRVVFLSNRSTSGQVEWRLLLDREVVVDEEAQAVELLALAEADANARHEVVDPYLIDVEEEGGSVRPTKYREAIRCLGPTTHLDHGKQSEGAEA